MSQTVKLPKPETQGALPLNDIILMRRSTRKFKNTPISLQDLSQLLWSGQGITGDQDFFRTVPSAGACHPLNLYVLVGSNGVSGLGEGFYKYSNVKHELLKISDEDLRPKLVEFAHNQKYLLDASINLFISGDYSKSQKRYEERGIRYTHIDLGHCAQNIHLEVESLGLGCVMVGAFEDEKIKEILNLPENESPLYIIPVGKKI